MSSRARDFKKGIDADDRRRNRSDTRVTVRKDKREEALAKKRRDGSSSATAAVDMGGAAVLAAPAAAPAAPAARDPTIQEKVRAAALLPLAVAFCFGCDLGAPPLNLCLARAHFSCSTCTST